MINLGRGWPDPSLLPSLQSLLNLSQSEVQHQQEQALQYGVDPGNLDMLQAVIQLRQQCASTEISADCEEGGPDTQGQETANTSTPKITTENIIITNGSSQGLDMVCLRFSRPGDIILVEPLSYCYIAATLEQHGLIPLKVPSTSEQCRTSCLEESRGNLMDLDALEDALETRRQVNGLMPKLLYLCPICHNPTATTMEEEEAKRLIAIARKYKFKLISDEVYMFLAFNCEAVPKSLVDYEMELVEAETPIDEGDDASSFVVLALNSFSKILGPGMRLGWIESCSNNIKVLQESGAIVSGGGLNPLGCSLVGAYLRSGQQETLIETLNTSYRTRCKVMMDALELDLGALPVTVEEIFQPIVQHPCYVRVTGGFFLWLRFPNHWNLDTEKLLSVCLEKQNTKEENEDDESVSFFAGHQFSLGIPLVGDKSNGEEAATTELFVPEVANHSIRICFAYLPEEDITKGISYLAKTAYDMVYSSK
ncbi:unnamed protein product [Cylindrotheca closterium]|uniref:Aminotransferase class I/classII large domain-containing protein n=1 Tax=Cylindrotheca closterium TaxID=2856 RepID=A0AAD2G4T3_9STRA|nr:unnamed protein product [Cylindrotheca closterium]